MASALGDDGAQRWPHALATRATRERGRRTLTRLLDAAVEELAAHGYRGARVSQVAKRAGTAHGSFYVYFEDKADLLVAMLDDVRADLDEVLLNPPDLGGATGLAGVEAWLLPACERLQRNAAVLAALTDAVVDGDDVRIDRAAGEMVAAWIAALADRIRATGAVGLDPAVAAGFLVHLITAANRAVAAGELPDPGGALPLALAEVVQRSLFGHAVPVHLAAGPPAAS